MARGFRASVCYNFGLQLDAEAWRGLRRRPRVATVPQPLDNVNEMQMGPGMGPGWGPSDSSVKNARYLKGVYTIHGDTSAYHQGACERLRLPRGTGNTLLLPRRRQHRCVSGALGLVVQKIGSGGRGSSCIERDGGGFGLLVTSRPVRRAGRPCCWVRNADRGAEGPNGSSACHASCRRSVTLWCEKRRGSHT